MRLLVGFTLVIFSVAFVQSQLVIPQVNNLNTVLALLPQIQVYHFSLSNFTRNYCLSIVELYWPTQYCFPPIIRRSLIRKITGTPTTSPSTCLESS